LPALNIRATATPQIVNRFITFIEFSSRGWIVNFALSRDDTRVLSFGCESNQRKERAIRENAIFKGSGNGRRAITAHPVVPRAKFAQGCIEPHGIESRTSLEFQQSQGNIMGARRTLRF
jgi:hypothetical protein